MILPKNRARRMFPRWCRVLVTKIIPPNKSYLRKQPDALPWEPTGPQGTASFWERTETIQVHPKQLSPFPERLELPFPSGEILSGFEDIVSSGTDQFTAWVKTDRGASLVRHMVDVQNATADCREASERRHDTSSQAYRFKKKRSNRSPVQKRLSTYNWNPGPRRGKADAFETAGRCMSSRYKKHLSMSIMTFLLIGST